VVIAMKTLALCCLLLAALVARAGAAAAFEGRLHLQRAELSEDPDKAGKLGDAHDIIYSVKGDHIRIEIIRDRVNTFLMDAAKLETITIIEDDRAYVVGSALAAHADAPKLEKTDETDKILDQPVRKYLVNSPEEGKTELWLTEGLGLFLGFGDGYERAPEGVDTDPDAAEPLGPRAWEYALARQPLFPLRVITKDDTGTVIFKLEAKAITPQPLSERLFAPSPNYNKRD
jgi:hypothetical protein